MSKEKTNQVERKYFSVKTEATTTVTLFHKVLAESPEEAAELAIKLAGQKQSSPPIINFSKLHKKKIKVYQAGSINLEYTKNVS